MKMEWCEDTKTISIGDFKTGSFVKMNLVEWTNIVLNENGVDVLFKPTKEKYKSFTDKVGCTPSVLYKMFNKLQYKVYVVPYLEYVNKIGFRKSGVNCYMLEDIIKNKVLLDQAKADNLMNLIPFICHHSKSPAELKVMFGKHWKKIANNSLHKNKYLVKYGLEAGDYAEFPTTLLKHRTFLSESVGVFKHFTQHYKGRWKIAGGAYTVLQLYRDTERLADALGKAVNPTWSPRRLKEEHDKFSKEVNAKMYSKDVFSSLEKIKVKGLMHKSRIYATLLDNAFDIADEGTCMSHCVGGYSGDVARGTYLVYSIRDKDGLRLSTLGIIVYKHEDKASFMLNQNYGKYNAIVNCKEQVELVNDILTLLNNPSM